ncbi:MAG: resolvase-like protein [Steroidobacteraceae bacterium]
MMGTDDATTAKVATNLLSLRIENNSKFVRGKKRARKGIERYCPEEYAAKQRPNGEYELRVPYSSEEDLDETMYELLGDIASQADDRHCFSERRPRISTRAFSGCDSIG